jgi:hypothetical protein
MLNLGFDLRFANLYERDGLQRIDAAFLAELAATDAALHARLGAARRATAGLDARQTSQLLIDLAASASGARIVAALRDRR